jgi:transcriptional regulator with XRE-family HTH domain
MECDGRIMENEDQQFEGAVGAKLKALRSERAMTLDALATASNVSRAMISRIERGEASPTASLLARICSALGLSLSAFFAGEGETVSPLSRRHEQQVWRDPETGYIRRAISPSSAASAVDIVEVEMPAGGLVSFPPHLSSRGMTQHVWVFDGELDMTTGGIVHRLFPGDCLFMPVGDGHAFHNPTSKPARYCVVLDRSNR